MSSQVLITPVDEIVTYIKAHPRTSIQNLSAVFKIKEDLVEKWVTILEEQGVLRVEFSGLDSIVTFVTQQTTKKIDVENIKELFVQSCYKKKVPTNKMKELWEVFFHQYEAEIKAAFEKLCEKKKFEKNKIPNAWLRFRATLEKL